MNASFKGIVRDIFPSDKKPMDYVTFLDRDTGGDVKLTFPRGMVNFKVNDELYFDVVVKGRAFGNGVGFEVVSFTSHPADVVREPAGTKAK